MAENILIKELLDNPFSVRPIHNKLKTVNKGQPTPPFFFFFSSGPRAYAPDAPQPVGLLCYPSVLDIPTFAASPPPRPCYPRDP
jgi:hypothetical protein